MLRLIIGRLVRMRLPGGVIRCVMAALLTLSAAACSAAPEPRFEPTWVKFLSDSEGWTGGYWVNCADCPRLMHTKDEGRSWQSVADPPAGWRAPVFADARNWFVINKVEQWQTDAPAMWSTHDGGATWARVDLPAGVGTARWADPVIGNGTVQMPVLDVATGQARMLSSSVAADEFTLSQPFPFDIMLSSTTGIDVDAVRAGSVTWLAVAGIATPGPAAGARFVDGEWTPWPMPISSARNPELVAISATELIASAGPKGLPESNRLYLSTDSGDTYTDIGPLTPNRVPARLIAAATTKDLVMMAATGDTRAPYGVQTSHDGGHTWATTLSPPGAAVPHSAAYIGGFGEFFTPTVGFVAVPFQRESDLSHRLFLTRDGGDTWAEFVVDRGSVR